MDTQPSGGSPSSSSSSSQRKAHKRPWDSDEDPPSLGSSETSSHPATQLDSTGPGASADGATTSKVASLLEESDNTLDEDDCTDSESSDEDSSFAGDCTDSEISDEDSSFAEGSMEYESSSSDPVTSDSESSGEDSVTPRKPPGKDEEHAGPISLSIMKSINGRFIGETLDYRLPCTAAEGTTCQIIDHLSVWNEFLCPVSWQLREMPGSSGKLSLAFFREPSQRYSSPQKLHLVTLLACQLLKTHHCVAHVEFDIYLFMSHHEILSDALRVSPSITSVKLKFCGGISGDDLATAALSLPHLQELEYAGYTQHSATLVVTLSSYLRTTTSLAALRVSDQYPRGLNSEDFFQALGQNCSLKELVLPGHFIAEAPPSAQAAFTEWLMNSVSLKSLTVASTPLKCILGALLGNRSIVAVDFTCREIGQADVQLMSKIFEQNKILQSFKISCESHYHSTSSFVQGHRDKSDCDRCLKALVENHSLEELALPIDVWNEDQWRELFEALPAKTNLKRVSIEALGRAPAPFLAKLCAALTETGADEKVSFNEDFTAEELDERFACKAFSAVVVHVSDRNTAKVNEIVDLMPSLGHITSLHLEFDILEELDRVLSSAVTTFLGATRTLKALSVSTPWDVLLYDFQEALMAGLAANTSLREVRIDVDETRDDFSVFSEPLADAINASKTISRVHLEVEGENCGECAFFQRLSAGIAENFTLLSVTVQGYRYSKFKRYWFEVWDTARRNYGLLTSAADFARGARRDRRCALALERMHGHPELVEEVARLEKVDQARAAAMVRDGLRSIEGMHAFMRLAGVVKESVSCHACKDGRTQLDSLNEDCWREIRRYLKLRDVWDPSAGVRAQ